MKPCEQATNRLATADRLDRIRMSSDERRMARASTRQAGSIAAMLIRAKLMFPVAP